MPRHLKFQPAQVQPTQPQPAQVQPAQVQPAQTQPAQLQPTDAQLLLQYENEIRGIDSQISNLNARRGELQSKHEALKNKLNAARKKEVEDLIRKAASKMGKTEDQIRALIKSLVDAGIDEIPTLMGMINT